VRERERRQAGCARTRLLVRRSRRATPPRAAQPAQPAGAATPPAAPRTHPRRRWRRAPPALAPPAPAASPAPAAPPAPRSRQPMRPCARPRCDTQQTRGGERRQGCSTEGNACAVQHTPRCRARARALPARVCTRRGGAWRVRAERAPLRHGGRLLLGHHRLLHCDAGARLLLLPRRRRRLCGVVCGPRRGVCVRAGRLRLRLRLRRPSLLLLLHQPAGAPSARRRAHCGCRREARATSHSATRVARCRRAAGRVGRARQVMGTSSNRDGHFGNRASPSPPAAAPAHTACLQLLSVPALRAGIPAPSHALAFAVRGRVGAT
jgi:hypothetical protein